MISLKKNEILFNKKREFVLQTPDLILNTKRRNNLLNKTKFLYNEKLTYGSNETKLMKEVNNLLRNKSLIEMARSTISTNSVRNSSQNLKLEYDLIYHEKTPENFYRKTESELSSINGKKTPKHVFVHDHEIANTEDSSEHYTHSTHSFKNALSSSTSFKSRSKTKRSFFKLKSSNQSARKFFQHKVRIVIALLKIIDFAIDRERRKQLMKEEKMDQITELVQDTFKTPTDSDKVVFNKDFYKAKKETDISRDMQFSLTIPPESRTHEQIRLARNGLLKMESFAEYPVNMQEKICKCAFYQKVPAKRVIIRQGQVADSFYFIISGQAMVTVMDEDKKTGDIKSRILAVLKDGTCFGELAFLYNTTRTATVTSLTNMELLSIGRDDFFDIFMSNRGQEPEHIRFLRNCPFSKGWPIEVLLENPTSCVFHYYKRDQVIVQNSTKSDYIYVIKSGSCQVLKRLNEVKPNKLLPSRASLTKENLLSDNYKPKIDFGHRFKKKSSAIPWSVTAPTGETTPKKQEPKPLFLQVQLLKAGDTFGLSILKFDESDCDVPNPELSLISNGAEVLMLKKDLFVKYSNDEVKHNIRQMLQPFPSTKEMQRKLQEETDWKYYKSKHMKELYTNMRKSANLPNIRI